MEVQLQFDSLFGHDFVKGSFIAKGVPPFGYKVYWIQSDETPHRKINTERGQGVVRVENELIKIEIEEKSGL